jgi:hypothetical protein
LHINPNISITELDGSCLVPNDVSITSLRYMLFVIPLSSSTNSTIAESTAEPSFVILSKAPLLMSKRFEHCSSIQVRAGAHDLAEFQKNLRHV